MGRKSSATTKNAKIPRHITKIAMTSEQYYALKVCVGSIILPGTPAFECKRLASNGNKQIYRQWLNNALEDIGPRFFPGGANGLVWPEDHDSKDVGDTGDTDGREDDRMLDEDEKYAQWEQEEEKMMAFMAMMDQENQDNDTMEEGMNAEPIELRTCSV